MSFHAPNPPSGSSLQAAWLRRLADAVRACRILSGRGYKVKRTSTGTILEIESGAGGNSLISWKGEWDSETIYKPMAIVRVTTIPPELVGDGNNYTGVWLAVKEGKENRPIWPEPDTLYWVMLAMGVREINVSSDDIGAKQMLTSCNDPYTAIPS